MTAAAMPPPPSEGVPFYTETGNARPRSVKGRFRDYKWWLMALTLAWWHLAPFMRWDRGPASPDQAILIDMAGRRAYFFFIEIWPQEVYYLTGMLLIAAIVLFMMSAMAGRIWCGFLCWQTVYTDLFVAVERKILGDRNARIAFSQQPLSLGKIARIALVNLCWMVISAACGIGFVLWFGDAFQTLRDIFTAQASLQTYLFITIIGGFCFLLAGYTRERVCVYMCPYARIQSGMFDEHSLIVSYEAWRGEPREHVKGTPDFSKRGHCVDCGLCVQSCPTGIDIRRGTQLACIGCGLCVDACNGVMERFGLPKNLISYDSSFNMVARSKGQKPQYKLIRPRTVIYMTVVAVAGTAILTSLLLRSDTRVDVLHARAPLAVSLSGGKARNGYDYKILNMARDQRNFSLEVPADPESIITVVGGETAHKVALTATPDSVSTFHIYVNEDRGNDTGNRPLTFLLTDSTSGKMVSSTSFFAQPE
jgi:cytochrome c oxidase accessory protein FixG